MQVADSPLPIHWHTVSKACGQHARVNSLRDPETTQGLAKPYYEAALSILEQKSDATKSVLDVYKRQL